MSRPDYARTADAVMNYVIKELGTDKITALPFVTNIVNEIQPVLENIVNRELEEQNNETT